MGTEGDIVDDAGVEMNFIVHTISDTMGHY